MSAGAGTVDDRLVAAIDLLPTLLDAIGAGKPAGMQGQVFLGDHAAPRQYVFGARDRCDETNDQGKTLEPTELAAAKGVTKLGGNPSATAIVKREP